jgi:UDP-glucose 6-dehydrogenase
MDVFDAGYRGYGGKCLPKDSKSLLDLARTLNVRMDVLSAADGVNASLRPETRTRPDRLRVPFDESAERQQRAA